MNRSARARPASRKPPIRRDTPDAAAARRRLVLIIGGLTVVVVLALVALVLLGRDTSPDERALAHARAACDVAGKAATATEVDAPERYAAAAFLLDTAILETSRAASLDPEFRSLDQSMQAVHSAAHRGVKDPWREALGEALGRCRDVVGG